MKGAYALVLRISQPLDVLVGSLGPLTFKSGIWVYIGSAMGEGSTSLENRVKRHFSDDKSIFWHIDRIIASGAKPSDAILVESDERVECQLSEALVESLRYKPGPKGFGASDCQHKCRTHLFQYIGEMPVLKSLKGIFTRIGLNPQTWQD